jgi:hypothetical protein
VHVLPPEKVKELRQQFEARKGVRAAARAVGVHRDTAMRYRRAWVNERLQAAYDEMWDNANPEACDAICATLPAKAVTAMLDEWMEDQFRDKDQCSRWYHRAGSK